MLAVIVLINLKAIRKLGDAVGGVEINVPKTMYYNDSRQNLAIALEPGLQTDRNRRTVECECRRICGSR